MRGVMLHALHGRIANLPAHHLVVEADTEANELRVTGVVDECRFHFHKLRLRLPDADHCPASRAFGSLTR